MPHPFYAPMHWVCIVDPGERSRESLADLMRAAQAQAQARFGKHLSAAVPDDRERSKHRRPGAARCRPPRPWQPARWLEPVEEDSRGMAFFALSHSSPSGDVLQV